MAAGVSLTSSLRHELKQLVSDARRHTAFNGICPECLNPLGPRPANVRYCSDRCRKRRHAAQTRRATA